MQNLKIDRNQNNVQLKQDKKIGRGKREIERERGRETQSERDRERNTE